MSYIESILFSEKHTFSLFERSTTQMKGVNYSPFLAFKYIHYFSNVCFNFRQSASSLRNFTLSLKTCERIFLNSKNKNYVSVKFIVYSLSKVKVM